MMHGAAGTLAEPFYRNFSAALTARGVATLRANNRGHDVVNRGDGAGRFWARPSSGSKTACSTGTPGSTCSRRAANRRILLFGHSLGAVKSAYYLATEPDPRVRGCVLASPPRFNTERVLASERGAEFSRTLAAARALVAAGKPDELMPTVFPLRSFSGAQAYWQSTTPARASTCSSSSRRSAARCSR